MLTRWNNSKWLFKTVLTIQSKRVYYSVYLKPDNKYFIEIIENPNQVPTEDFEFDLENRTSSIPIDEREKEELAENILTYYRTLNAV